MVKKKRQSRAKSSRRALNALELADRQVGGYSSGSDDNQRRFKRSKNVAILLKRAEDRAKSNSDDVIYGNEMIPLRMNNWIQMMMWTL